MVQRGFLVVAMLLSKNPEQIEDYELDLDKIIEKNVIDKLDHMLYGIGSSNQVLRTSQSNTKLSTLQTSDNMDDRPLNVVFDCYCGHEWFKVGKI